MAVTLKRILTKKSKIGFGKYKHETVEKMIGMKMNVQLISMYYKLEKIGFTEDVLDELKIPLFMRLEKPKKDVEMYYQCLDLLGYARKINLQRASIKNRELRGLNSGLGMLPKTKPESKSRLKGINNGRR